MRQGIPILISKKALLFYLNNSSRSDKLNIIYKKMLIRMEHCVWKSYILRASMNLNANSRNSLYTEQIYVDDLCIPVKIIDNLY